jgi:hypothetical protein
MDNHVYLVEGLDTTLTEKVVAYLKVVQTHEAHDDPTDRLVDVQGFNDLGEPLSGATANAIEEDRFETAVAGYTKMSESDAQRRAQADQGEVGPEHYGTEEKVSRGY